MRKPGLTTVRVKILADRESIGLQAVLCFLSQDSVLWWRGSSPTGGDLNSVAFLTWDLRNEVLTVGTQTAPLNLLRKP